MRSSWVLVMAVALLGCSKGSSSKSSAGEASGNEGKVAPDQEVSDELEDLVKPREPVPDVVLDVARQVDEEYEPHNVSGEKIEHELPLPGLTIYALYNTRYDNSMACFSTGKGMPACGTGAFELAVNAYDLGKQPDKLTDSQWIELVGKAFQLDLVKTAEEAKEREVPADVAAKVTPSLVERKTPLVVRATYVFPGGLTRDAHPGVKIAVAEIDAANKVEVRFDWPD